MMNVSTATRLSWGRCDEEAYSTFVTFEVSFMQGNLMFGLERLAVLVVQLRTV